MKNSIKDIIRIKGFYAIVVLIVFSVVFLLLEIHNGRFWQSDFTVYYKSAYRILHGENLFGIEDDGHYVFKYSPSSAIFFIPFSVLPREISVYIYWFFLTSVIIAGFYSSVTLSTKIYSKQINYNKVILLAALVTVVHFQRELHLGQVNQILFLIYVIMALALFKNMKYTAASLLAISIFIKPFGLIFIPYFAVNREWKLISYLCGAMVVLFFLPLLFYDWNMFIIQNKLWINEIVIELNNKQDLMLSANHTVFSVIARYTGLGHLLGSPLQIRIFQIAVLSLLVIWFMFLFVINNVNTKNNLITEVAVLIALIPLLSFTSHNAFGFSELLIVLILVFFKELSLLLRVISIIGMILIGGNYYDLWGKYLSNLFNDISLVSVGTILLIIVASTMRVKKIA